MSAKRWTILEVLDWTRGHFENKGLDNPRLDAEILIAHALDTQRVMLYARYDQQLQPDELTTIRELVKRRANFEPVAYLLGNREFWSLDLKVTPATLIPRPDTEVLVQATLNFIKDRDSAVIVDVGTGSGCVALALASERKEDRVIATDISEDAIKVAQENADALNLSEQLVFLHGSLLEPVDRMVRADAIVANLPYIPSGECEKLMPDVRDHEPRSALDGGEDGLDLIRQLILQAPLYLQVGGLLALEAGAEQVPHLEELLPSGVWNQAEIHEDIAGRPRVMTTTFIG